MIDATGTVLGTVRKQHPAGAESHFFRGEENDHVIDSPLGRIGVGICQENYRCFLPMHLHALDADLVLTPFSYPDLSATGGLGSPPGSVIGGWYARQLGIPVVTSNKTGNWPQVSGAYFPGESAIVAADRTVIGELDDQPGILVSDVTLDQTAKTKPDATCIGPFLKDLTLGSWLAKRITWAKIRLMALFDSTRTRGRRSRNPTPAASTGKRQPLA